MQQSFWLESWQEGGHRTSFHRPDVHPLARDFLPPHVVKDRHVFVPLCGKDNVLTYFRQHAAHVTGIELSRTAIEQYNEEHQAGLRETAPGRFEANGITLLNQDLFQLAPNELRPIDIVWDRASLIAFPDDEPASLRQRYIGKMHELTPAGALILLITLEYGPLMNEPPFSVGPDTIRDYFDAGFQVEHLVDLRQPEHRMVSKFGLSFLSEHAFAMTRRGGRPGVADRIAASAICA
jgi:thiopurine S-methyltransferase